MKQTPAKKTIGDRILESRRKRVTSSQAERKHMVDGVAFGLIHDEWTRFKAQLLKGDGLWYFRTPDDTWQTAFPRCGLEGYAIVRGGALIAEIFTSIS
jgi:hypothetical protein